MRRAVSLYYAALWRDEAACLLAASRDLLLGRRHPAEIRWSEEVAARIARMTGAAGAFTFPSARSALLATLRAMGVGPGHEVIVTGYTCAAVPAPVLYCGAAPVYVDIEPQTFNVEPLHVERAVSKRTRVVVVQHTYGNPAPVDAIVSMARSRGLQVIEDCCLALGSLDRGRPLGTRGDAAIVSFELSKTLSAGWGGAVWFNAPGLRDRLAAQHAACEFPSRVRAARLAWQVGCSYGLYHPSAYRAGRYVAAALYRSRLFRVSTTAGEARGLWRRDFLTQPSDIHWQVLARQLERLDGIVDWGRRAAATYRTVLDRHGVRTYPRVSADTAPAWIRFPFLVARRESFRRFFARRGIEVGQWFDDPVSGASDPTVFGYVPGTCPAAERVARHVVNLPVSTRLTAADVTRVADTLDAYLRAHPETRDAAEPTAQGTAGVHAHG